MLNEFASGWFDESSRWVDATLKTAASESDENAALLGQWIAVWRTRALAALRPIAVQVLGDAPAESALRVVAETFDTRLAKQGVVVSQTAAELTDA